jgi:hypothetical protein
VIKRDQKRTRKSDETPYLSLVRDFMESGSAEMIANGEPDHARALFQTFFEYAETSVIIFSRRLDSDIFGTSAIVTAAKSAVLDRNIRLEIISQESPDDSDFTELVRKLAAKCDGRVTLKPAASDEEIRHFKANFAVMDGKAFRYEKDHSHIEAVAIMNSPEMAVPLTETFNAIRSHISIY